MDVAFISGIAAARPIRHPGLVADGPPVAFGRRFESTKRRPRGPLPATVGSRNRCVYRIRRSDRPRSQYVDTRTTAAQPMIRRLAHVPVSTTKSACALMLDGGYVGADDATPLISTRRGGHARGRAILGCDGQLRCPRPRDTASTAVARREGGGGSDARALRSSPSRGRRTHPGGAQGSEPTR